VYHSRDSPDARGAVRAAGAVAESALSVVVLKPSNISET